MITRAILSSVIAISLLNPIPATSANLTAQTQTTPDPRVEKIKLQVESLGIGAYVIVTPIRGRKIDGVIARIGDTEFEVSDAYGHRQTIFTIEYREVRKIEDGLNSRRKWLIIGAASVVALPIIFYLATRSKVEGFPR